MPAHLNMMTGYSLETYANVLTVCRETFKWDLQSALLS